jgi:hypothetical protein
MTLVLSRGWFLSKHPDTGNITLNIPELVCDTQSEFKRYNDEEDVWMKISGDTTYVLSWETNARTLYENHVKNCTCGEPVCQMLLIPEDVFDWVMLNLEDTRAVMEQLIL